METILNNEIVNDIEDIEIVCDEEDASASTGLAEAYINASQISESVLVASEIISDAVQSIDISGIVEALKKMVSAIVDHIAEDCKKIMENLPEAFAHLLQSIYGWFGRGYSLICKRRRTTRGHFSRTLISIVVLCPCIKLFAIKFSEYAANIRSIFILHNQNKGSDSEDSENNYAIFSVVY